MNYNIVVLAKSSVTMGMMQQNKVTGSKMCAGVAVFTPGGSPRVTEGCAIVEVVVWINPEASVRTKVAMLGNPPTVGNAVILRW